MSLCYVVLLSLIVCKHLSNNSSKHVIHWRDGRSHLLTLYSGYLLFNGGCCCDHKLFYFSGDAFFHISCHISHWCVIEGMAMSGDFCDDD
ncbi:hypothetical protein M758_4G246600 [Ceratodon purpureus]|nr:hypothetical protein M758_4G246600 [Ceratodon purpureus]